MVSGQLEVVRPLGSAETLVALHGPGQFTGEVNMVSGRRAPFRARVLEPGEVIEVDRQRFLALMQTDVELGEILMRAFLLRRVELLAAGVGDAVLVGSNHSAGTLRIKEFLMRNGHPYSFLNLEKDPDVERLLDYFHLDAGEIPVVICQGRQVLRNPSVREVAECLGFNEAIDQTHLRDLVIIGAGPAGLAAAVYGASEGLDVLVVETRRRAVRQVRVQKLKITSDFQPASPAPNLPTAPILRRRSSGRRYLSPGAGNWSATKGHTGSKWTTGLKFRHAPW